jgi:hypothetical protein
MKPAWSGDAVAETGGGSVAGGRDDEVLEEVISERAQDRVWVALSIGGRGEMLVQAVDGHADGADSFLGSVPACMGGQNVSGRHGLEGGSSGVRFWKDGERATDFR